MTTQRIATCRCGALSATCHGDPVRVSICHCLACKQHTGSAFSWTSTWVSTDVQVRGEHRRFNRTSDDGGIVSYDFCPHCGSTVVYALDARPGMVSLPVGAFADRDFPAPTVEVYTERRSAWCDLSGANLRQE